jgi:hypothetical protein
MDGPGRRRVVSSFSRTLLLERGCEPSRIEAELWTRAYDFAVPRVEPRERHLQHELAREVFEPDACLAAA